MQATQIREDLKMEHEERIKQLDAEIMRLQQQLNEDKAEHEKEEKAMTQTFDA